MAILLSLAAGFARPAAALTFGLQFVTGPTLDTFSVGTTAADYSGFGFSGMSTAQIQQSILDAVIADYLAYPTVGENPLSPLQNGLGLNIDFILTTNTLAPLNADPEYFFVAIGNGTTGESFLGQACYACVRTAAGGGASAGAGTLIGSILVDNIASLAGLATTNAQRIQLLAGTIAHEIGHALSLVHPNGMQANPGASPYDLMATGAEPTNMPNSERVKDRAFSYTQFDQLIGAVGTRDFAVPEPAGMWLSGMGVLLVAGTRWRRRG